MELHPDCEPLAFLLGTWRGSGAGEYPTIESFRYNEEVMFGHVGKPFLSYTQKTRDHESGQPLHAEAGYLRAIGNAQVELVIAQPSGIVELHHGHVDGHALVLTLDGVYTTPSAKQVTQVQRSLAVSVDEDRPTMHYDVSMAAVGQPLTHHLRAELMHQS